MKIVFAVLISLAVNVTFAEDVKNLVGENKSPEYRDCLAEDQCPSQACPGSCAMKNKSNDNLLKNSAGKTNVVKPTTTTKQ
jgi:hypothetical protein